LAFSLLRLLVLFFYHCKASLIMMKVTLFLLLACVCEAWVLPKTTSRPLTRHFSTTQTSTTAQEPRVVANGKLVQVNLNDATFQFHSMWLRDACRDENNIVPKAGERKLVATPVGPLSHVDPSSLQATTVEWQDDILQVQWNEASPNVPCSTFSREFLERYAPVVAKKIDGKADTEGDDWNNALDVPAWLEPYSGYPDAKAPTDFENWDENETFLHFDHQAVMQDPHMLLKLLKTLLVGKGVALVDNVPTTDNASELIDFIQHSLGGLQKDPTRQEPNWKIVHQPSAASISYDPAKRLYQHTDSSIPPHGIPGLALSMHYVKGYGANTLTDGYSVANYIKETDPKGYDLLSTYGYDGERDFAASRVDSTQDIAKGLLIPRRHAIFVNDDDGNISRIQYNEVFRMPLTLPFDVFEDWFAAFSKFVKLIHEFEVTVPMEEGSILLMNNWRVLHGRAGKRASPDRHVVGGTIVREAMYSRAIQLARALRKDNGDL